MTWSRIRPLFGLSAGLFGVCGEATYAKGSTFTSKRLTFINTITPENLRHRIPQSSYRNFEFSCLKQKEEKIDKNKNRLPLNILKPGLRRLDFLAPASSSTSARKSSISSSSDCRPWNKIRFKFWSYLQKRVTLVSHFFFSASTSLLSIFTKHITNTQRCKKIGWVRSSHTSYQTPFWKCVSEPWR